MSEHLPDVEIEWIDLENCVAHVHDGRVFRVGFDGVTRIEAFTKSGMHADIPYVRVWNGDEPIAEMCQHSLLGVYFKTKEIIADKGEVR
jgi:hypothetical protein